MMLNKKIFYYSLFSILSVVSDVIAGGGPSKITEEAWHDGIEAPGRTLARPIVWFVDGVTPKQAVVSSGIGKVPVEISICNSTDVDICFQKYQISFGKVVEEYQAPMRIAANSIGKFLASSRVAALYGAEGSVEYKASDDSFTVVAHWSNPLETGTETKGWSEVSGRVRSNVQARTSRGMHSTSYITFDLTR